MQSPSETVITRDTSFSDSGIVVPFDRSFDSVGIALEEKKSNLKEQLRRSKSASAWRDLEQDHASEVFDAETLKNHGRRRRQSKTLFRSTAASRASSYFYAPPLLRVVHASEGRVEVLLQGRQRNEIEKLVLEGDKIRRGLKAGCRKCVARNSANNHSETNVYDLPSGSRAANSLRLPKKTRLKAKRRHSEDFSHAMLSVSVNLQEVLQQLREITTTLNESLSLRESGTVVTPRQVRGVVSPVFGGNSSVDYAGRQYQDEASNDIVDDRDFGTDCSLDGDMISDMIKSSIKKNLSNMFS